MENISSVAHDKCVGCESCENICPKNAIKMSADKKGFFHPVVDTLSCVNCGKCVKVCPVVNHAFNDFEQIVYALTINDEKARFRSSSGGAFYWIASHVLSKKGIVYGAAFEASSQVVKHIRVDSIDNLYLLQNSKYVQSRITHTYSDAQKDLEMGKLVLFSGTPCQIAGLYSFLGKQYDKLFTCDILCYGVPSPLVLSKYLLDTVGNDVVSINMRDKKYGWVNYSMYLQTSNGIYRMVKTQDLYQLGFQTHIFYRESCYNCVFRKTQRVGDFTLGDFWHFKESFANGSIRNNDTGISFFMINSSKGSLLFNELDKSKITYERRSLEENIKNFGFGKQMSISKNRDTFFKSLESSSYKDSIQPYICLNKKDKVSVIRRIYRKMKRSYYFRKLLNRLNIPV